MNLKSFGCSFVYGSELSDDRGTQYHPSQLTWPALYAQRLGYTYECYARPAAGNLQILEQVLNQAAGDDNDLYIIGWSWIDRFDYTTTNNQWCSILPVDTTESAKLYYRDLHSEYRDKFTGLSYIRLAIDTLQQKSIPYIMTYMDHLLFDQRWHTTPAVLELQSYIEPHMTRFEGQSFLEWSRSNGYPETAAWHPLEQAHRAAADYILSLGINKV